MAKLLEKYRKELAPGMAKTFGYKNIMAVPKITKVVLNTGFGKLVAGKTGDEQKKIYTSILDDLSLICGQRPALTRAKKSIAGFKVRQGMPVGASVTLHSKKMYDFLERLIDIALPRSRDFRGLDSKSFDKKGSFTIGLKEQIVFPEVSPEKSKNIFGFEVTIITNAKNREEGLNLLKTMGFPIK